MICEKQNSVPSEILTVKQEIQRMTFIFMSVSFLSVERGSAQAQAKVRFMHGNICFKPQP